MVLPTIFEGAIPEVPRFPARFLDDDAVALHACAFSAASPTATSAGASSYRGRCGRRGAGADGTVLQATWCVIKPREKPCSSASASLTMECSPLAAHLEDVAGVELAAETVWRARRGGTPRGGA